MQEVDSIPSLRPLGIGEILDRAVNLSVKFFLPLLLIYIVYGIPFAVAAYFFTLRYTAIVQSAIALPGTGTHAAIPSFPPDLILMIGAIAIVFLFTLPLPTAALIESASAFYLGRKTSFAQAYRVAFERYLQMLLLTFFYLGAGIGVYIVVGLVAVLIVVGVALIAAVAKIVGIILAVVLGLIGIAIAIVLFVVVSLMLQVGYYTCVIERASCTTAFTLAIKRTFSGIGIRRTLLVGLVYFAIALGIGIVSAMGQFAIQGLLHAAPVMVFLSLTYSAILRVVTSVLMAVFLTVFYFDLRVREEGLDLEFAAARASAAAIPTT